MKYIASITLSALVLSLTGCTTSSQVQEMIDASYREQTDQLASHDASIDVLKKSAMTGLEKGKENMELLAQLQTELVALEEQVKTNKGYAEASKVMSAANTVKVAELSELLKSNTEADEELKERLIEIDRLHEAVMISHYEMIAESALKAAEDLKSNGWIGSSNAPVKIDEPIEIVAPTTAPPTNSAGNQ